MTLTDRFERFCEANPHVYDELVVIAHRMHARGMRKVSVDFVYQVARWEHIQATDELDYKLNDHYRAFYARLIMLLEPELAGFFDIRNAESDRWLAAPPSDTMQRIIAHIRNGQA